ncbi:MAG: aldehyde dehydrogenase family protein, partial [Pseudomonadota bacterium]|nr:aldehyde dehydrogenase family protein [Pseudomonadota bacterium]
MRDYTKFYINGAWVAPSGSHTLAVENPATLEQCAAIAIGNEADVDTAVAAAKAAFETFSQTSVEERAALLDKIAEIYMSRIGE